MSLTENGGTTMLVQPSGFGGYGNGLFGGDGAWWIIILLLCGFGGWGMGGFGGGMWPMMMGGMGGWGMDYLYPWLNNSQNINDGFRDQQLQTSITSIGDKVVSGFGDVQLGLAGVNQAICQTGNGISQQLYNNEIANLNRSFAEQTANAQGFNSVQGQLAQCCCDNRLATVQTQNVVQNEGAATRLAIQAQTQAILDKMCQDKIDAKNDEIAQLRQEVLFARGQASQIAQNQTIVDSIYNRLDTCPVGTTPVYGRTPIFTCGQNSGCGCGGNNFFN